MPRAVVWMKKKRRLAALLSTGKVAGDALSFPRSLIMAARHGNAVFILIWRKLLRGCEPEGLPTKSVWQSIPRATFCYFFCLFGMRLGWASHVRRLLGEREISISFCID